MGAFGSGPSCVAAASLIVCLAGDAVVVDFRDGASISIAFGGSSPEATIEEGGVVVRGARGPATLAIAGADSGSSPRLRTFDLDRPRRREGGPAPEPVLLGVGERGERYVAGLGGVGDGPPSIFVAKLAAEDSSVAWVTFLAREETVFEGPLAAGCPGTINFDNSAATGAWATAANWDLDRLPDAADDVCIGAGFAVTMTSTTQSIQSLTTDAAATLTLGNSSLTLASASTIGGTLTMTGGTIDGAGDLTIAGLFTWNGGQLAGGGTVLANGGMAIGGSAVKDLSPRALQAAGTVTWTGTGAIRLGGGSSIQSAGTWLAQSDAQLSPLSGGGTLTNGGTFRKSGGAGTTTIGIDFDSPGPIEIQTGTLSLTRNGTASSTITGSAGTALRFNGVGVVYTLASTSSLSVPTVIFDAGTIEVNGTYAATTGTTVSGAVANFNGTADVTSIGSSLTLAGGTANFASGETIAPATLALSSGTLTGSDTVTISGLLTWTGGSMAGNGITNADGGISIGGSAVKDILARTLRSSGTTTWTGAGSIRLGGGSSIESSGTWNAGSDAAISILSGGGSFTNTGTFRKTAGAGTTTIGVDLDSDGGIEIQSGILSINGDATIAGSVTGGAGTTLRFNGIVPSVTLTGTSSVGVPTVILDGGTIDVNGAYAATTGTTVSGATANFNPSGTVSSIGGALTISGGTANFSSGETIAPSTLSLTGGALTGGDTVTVSGLVTWTAGAMTGAASTIAGGGIALSGAAVKDLSARTLRNDATASWSGTGQIRLGSGATIRNDGLWDAQSDTRFDSLSGGGTFLNNGTLRKSAGSGSTTIAVAFDSPGAIEIATGTLAITEGGSIAGSVTGSAGTTLRFGAIAAPTTLTGTSSVAVPLVVFDSGPVTVSGGYAATTGTTVSGASTTFDSSSTVTSIGAALTVTGGTVSFSSSETIAPTTLSLSGGTLQGNDTVTVSGLTTWTAGAMSGGGITNANGGVAFSGSPVKDLEARTLRTGGTTTWAGTGNIRLSGVASIENAGTWEIQGDGMITPLVPGGAFTNVGTLRKSGGSGVTTIAIPFSNGGAVEALAQTLSFTGGYTQTEGSTTLDGGTLTSSSTLDIQGGSLRGSGTVGASVGTSGTTSPGLSPAILAIGGSWTQSPTGSYAVEIGGLTAGSQHDRLDVASTASVAGTLDVGFINAFSPVAGDLFTILTTPARTGTFATTNFPPLGPALLWNVIYTGTAVQLQVVPLPSGRVPGDLSAESPLLVTKSGGNLALSWTAGCLGTDVDSEIYEGVLGAFTSHVPVVCSTGGLTTWTLTPGAGSRYYLVVPTNLAGEGSYGLDGTGTERPFSVSACRLQSIGPCP